VVRWGELGGGGGGKIASLRKGVVDPPWKNGSDRGGKETARGKTTRVRKSLEREAKKNSL